MNTYFLADPNNTQVTQYNSFAQKTKKTIFDFQHFPGGQKTTFEFQHFPGGQKILDFQHFPGGQKTFDYQPFPGGKKNI